MGSDELELFGRRVAIEHDHFESRSHRNGCGKERSLQKPLKPLLQVFSRRLLLRRLRARRFPQDPTLHLYPSLAHSITHSLSLSVSPSLSFVCFLCAFVALCEIRSEGRDRPERSCDGEGGDVGSPAAEK